MHPEQQIFCLEVKLKFFPHYEPFHNARVLDCGSRDINGNNRFLFTNSEYVGVDICQGPNVDVVSPIHELTYPENSFDTVICAEVLEHDPHWIESIRNMIRMLKPGGLLIITCAGPERGPHSMHQAGGLTEGEYYHNLAFWVGSGNMWSPGMLTTGSNNGFRIGEEIADFNLTYGREGKDIYFWGIKAEEGTNDG